MPTPTPLSDAALDSFPEFISSVRARLDAGRDAYGDASFTRPTKELLDELMMEAKDLAGWGFILWYRCRELRRREV